MSGAGLQAAPECADWRGRMRASIIGSANRMLKNTLLVRVKDDPLRIKHGKCAIQRSRVRTRAGFGALKKGRMALFQQTVNSIRGFAHGTWRE